MFEQNASRFLEHGKVRCTVRQRDTAGILHLKGTVQEGKRNYDPALIVDRDERIVQAECTCNWFRQNRLYKGPCEHMLALRMFYARH